ncbi:MAG: hypothetical protein M3P12_07345 [Gemmatimonadota bacterium]|nr:hypothetical protein [Gemmatimonadota bacterium]
MTSSRLFRSLSIALAAVIAGACADYDAPTGISAPTVARLGASTTTDAAVLKTDGTKVPKAVKGSDTLVKTADATKVPKEVKGIKWNKNRPKGELRVTAVVGPAGGQIVLPGSDFTLTFSQGALSAETTITVISLDGDYVNYDLLPHGITFAQPVYAAQGLKNTEIYQTKTAYLLFGAYLAGTTVIDGTGSATATETTLSWIGLQQGTNIPKRSIWLLKHFSRYMLASG